MAIRVLLPQHLQTLAGTGREVSLDAHPPTIGSLIEAIEQRYPPLRGTLRDASTGKRRALVRFFACAEDISHLPMESPLPDAVSTGAEPFIIIGAIAGG